MDDGADAKVILTAPRSPDNWKRPPGRPRTTCRNTVQRDLRAYNLTLNEAVDLAHAEPSSVEAEVFARRYALLVVHARTEEDERDAPGRLLPLPRKLPSRTLP